VFKSLNNPELSGGGAGSLANSSGGGVSIMERRAPNNQHHLTAIGFPDMLSSSNVGSNG